jgi:hypothetical protein
MEPPAMRINVLNEAERNIYLSEQMQRLRSTDSDHYAARLHLQNLIEGVTSIRFGHKDRAALRSYLRKVGSLLRKGEIDERTAKVDLNKVLMAAAANSPDVLHYIHIEA